MCVVVLLAGNGLLARVCSAAPSLSYCLVLLKFARERLGDRKAGPKAENFGVDAVQRQSYQIFEIVITCFYSDE